MKKIYYISFFLVILLLIGGAFIGWRYHQKSISEKKQELVFPDQSFLQTEKSERITDCDTVWLIQKYDRNTKQTTIEEQKIPAQYIGVTRLQLVEMLSEYEKAPVLSDEKDGFEGVSLLSFSEDRVTILKTYDTSKGDYGYYLLAVDGDICVYYSDKKTLYFKTGLSLTDLPETIRAQLIYGKYFEKEKELYSFLESYTS